MAGLIWGKYMRGWVRDRYALADNWWLVLPFALVAGASVLIAVEGPALGLAVALAPIALYLLIAKSWARVAVLVGGGMLIFGPTDVGPTKIVYASAIVFCGLISGYRLLTNPPPWGTPFKPLLAWGPILFACLLLGTIATPGQDLTTVIRQSIAYVMIPLAPVVGLDAGRDIHSVTAMRWIGFLGCVSAAGVGADWLSRRGVSSLSFGRVVTGSLFISALAFALALVLIVHARGLSRFLWLIPIVVIPVPLLVTGTRTNLILFLALIGVLGASKKRRVPWIKAAGIAAFAVAAVIVVLPAVAQVVISQPGFLESRIQALLNVTNGTAADQSLEARNEQYYYTAQWIAESPWFGKGPGFSPEISMDTPLATVVRLGIVGTITLAGFLLACMWSIWRTGKNHGFTVMHTAMTGVAVVFVANLPFGSPVEDRGFSFMLILAFMGISSHVQERIAAAQDHSDYNEPMHPKLHQSTAYASIAAARASK